jgi:hypothetical protein
MAVSKARIGFWSDKRYWLVQASTDAETRCFPQGRLRKGFEDKKLLSSHQRVRKVLEDEQIKRRGTYY